MQRDKPIRPARRSWSMAVLAGFLSASTAAAAGAGTISRWVDPAGITHFGDEQFAPAGAESVSLQPANSMLKPEVPLTPSTGHSQSGASWTRLTLPEKQNRKGWRARKESLYTGRKHTNRSTRR